MYRRLISIAKVDPQMLPVAAVTQKIILKNIRKGVSILDKIKPDITGLAVSHTQFGQIHMANSTMNMLEIIHTSTLQETA